MASSKDKFPKGWPDPANPAHWSGTAAIHPETGEVFSRHELERAGVSPYVTDRTIAPGITGIDAARAKGLVDAGSKDPALKAVATAQEAFEEASTSGKSKD